MKKLLISLLASGLLLGGAGYTAAFADDDDERAVIKLKKKVKGLKQKVVQNSEDIQTNASNIADNFSAINGNSMDIRDLDERVSRLEASPPGGGAGGERSFVEVVCTSSNQDTLFQEPINGFFRKNTTYLISGACNGPVYVTEDGVHFVGTDRSLDSIILPADTPSPSDGAVFGDGAHDLRIQNLTVDASAWNLKDNEGSGTAGIYARNAFVRVIDSTVVGGEYGINPFRNAIVRLQGEVNIEEFLNVGISAGDQSLVTARDQVNISTGITEGSFMTGIELYRSGNMDFRRGVTVSLPPGDEPPFPSAISGSDNSHLRIRSRGIVNIVGNASMRSNSTLTMQGGTLAGGLFLDRGASAQLFGVFQTEGNNMLEGNSTMQSFNSTLANTSVNEGSVAKVFSGEIDGAIVQTLGILYIQDFATITNLISVEKPSLADINNVNMGENQLIYCDEDTIFIDETVNEVQICP